jgi:hypothetical protein
MPRGRTDRAAPCSQCGAPPLDRVPGPAVLTIDRSEGRPESVLGAHQPDQPGDAPTDPLVDLKHRTNAVCTRHRSRYRSEPAEVDESKLGKIQTDAGGAGQRLRDALFELPDRREIEVAAQREPHDAIRFNLLADVKFLQL